MLNKNEIVIRLKELGFKDENIDTVIADVVQIILGKSLGHYFLQLPENEQSRLRNFSADELMEYIEKNKSNLPKFSVGDFEKVYNETWEGYFNTISK